MVTITLSQDNKLLFFLDQKIAGATLEPIFLAEGQFFGCRKNGSRIGAGTKQALDPAISAPAMWDLM